ncbi:AarF/ABC1/UbiB kinase family protein [Aliiglaciecola sp. CAU 1673]|uniref:ABC1 kinase family protein n=1 Tax=Aliiglaciecola sp. CAU 1673 TaxID=3032595 RepID=UPI0023D9A9D1|nr:AarF/ABC1/UbiB kinase family protein [Aliiglaciecola sp. CAU 1673]MDF2177009.1 AarF/ABC1/UbiB kinase family protein [Aliiglaciecola sp. CAU 1673]
MTKDIGKLVPCSRLSRLGKLGSLASGIAGNMLVSGLAQLGRGQRPDATALLLQPRNIRNLADKLSHLRGAAMKVGQMLSMDAGDLLPPELSQLLSLLREQASPMPHKQLVAVMREQFGEDWLSQFSHFELRPFAAASIGQVHKAWAEDGTSLAVKVQYPGVAKSIESDVDNVAALLKLSGLVPKRNAVDVLLDEAKKQLLTEADYLKEAAFLQRYSDHVDGHQDFALPRLYPRLCTAQVLTMSFVEGEPIESLTSLPQEHRDHLVTSLIALFLKELFKFRLIQSDPNFANYRYQKDSGRLVLLDFGATRDIDERISHGYLHLLQSAAKGDRAAMGDAARQIGFFANGISEEMENTILQIFSVATEPLRHRDVYDFGKSDLAKRIKALGLSVNRHKQDWHTPPVDAIFIHRKVGGLYFMAARLQARVNVARLFAPYL